MYSVLYHSVVCICDIQMEFKNKQKHIRKHAVGLINAYHANAFELKVR